MAKKKKAPPKTMEELMKQLEEENAEQDQKEITKEEFDEALKKLLNTPKPKKPDN